MTCHGTERATRHTTRCLGQRKTLMTNLKWTLGRQCQILIVGLALVPWNQASAETYTSFDNGRYILRAGVPLRFVGTSEEIDGLSWTQPPEPLITSPQPLPGNEWFVDSTFDIVAIVGNPPTTPPPSQASIRGSGSGTDSRVYDLEISNFLLIDTSYILRESPTIESLGQTSIDIFTGGYRIDSFFDVFTELSLDGGATWYPSDGPVQMTSVPEPSGVALATLGLVGLLTWLCRRDRRGTRP